MYNRIRQLTDGMYPFHMPGHKRNPEFLVDCPDITEITGTDDLHHPEGILKEAQQRATRLFGVKKTFFSTCGSTAAILAAVTACTKSGDRVLIARNCHRSVYNAAFVNSLKAEYIMPETVWELGCFGAVSPTAVEAAIKRHPSAAVVITSPTYEGFISDISAIADIVHRHGAVLIVDAAHGAHLGFSESFPRSARHLGADLVVESAHKTLPCNTQAAFLHICSDRVEESRVKEAFSVYNTSSPSYPIMASMVEALDALENSGDALFQALSDRIDALIVTAQRLKKLSVYGGSNLDKSKLIIDCSRSSVNGFKLKELLREHKLECEMAMPSYVLCMTSIADTEEGFDRLANALCEIDKGISSDRSCSDTPTMPEPTVRMTIREALEGGDKVVAIENSIGRISADFVYAYPPGSPIIAPGELISEVAVFTATELDAQGANVYSSEGGFKNIKVIKPNN